MSKHHCSCGNPLVSAEAICEICDANSVPPRKTEMAKHRATVIKSYSKGKYLGLFVEITASDDDVVEPTVIASIPCETELQAWATADAFNYPDRNSNTWRDNDDELEQHRRRLRKP